MAFSNSTVMCKPNSLLNPNRSSQFFTLRESLAAHSHSHTELSHLSLGLGNMEWEIGQILETIAHVNSVYTHYEGDGMCSKLFCSDPTVIWRQGENAHTVSKRLWLPSSAGQIPQAPKILSGGWERSAYLHVFDIREVSLHGKPPKCPDKTIPGSSHT